jgi:lactose/L-arabinose transport system ATP-binding protein
MSTHQQHKKPMTSLQLRDVRKSYGRLEVIKGVSLEIEPKEFVVFVGPSGCGKSTLLRMIAGLEEISAGDLHIGGKRMNDVDPSKRGIAMVFQSYALYPHMSVRENMGFALRFAGVPKEEIARQVDEAARTLELGALMDRRPKELSGGQRQRVAIGRAIVRHPDVFLFDEPLSNLDAELRVHMRIELAKLHKALAATVIYVTHDQVEAMTLADKIVVMRDGLISQVGSPLDVFDNPDNMFVAGFIGSPKINFVKAIVESVSKSGTTVSLTGYDNVKVTFKLNTSELSVGAPVTVGLRPQHFGEKGTLKFNLNIDLVEHLGGESFVYAGNSKGELITVATQLGRALKAGQKFVAYFDPAKALLFDATGQRVR